MTPDQCRHARLLLGWTRVKLGAEAGFGPHVIAAYEKFGRIIPPETVVPTIDRLAAIRATLEAAGVEFADGDTPGVRLRPESMV